MKLFKPTVYQAVLEILSLLIVIACIVNLVIWHNALPAELPEQFDASGAAGGNVSNYFIYCACGVMVFTYLTTAIFLLIPEIRQIAWTDLAIKPGFRIKAEKETVNIMCELRLFGMAIMAYMQLALIGTIPENMTPYVMLFVIAMLLLAYRIIKIIRYKAEKKQP